MCGDGIGLALLCCPAAPGVIGPGVIGPAMGIGECVIKSEGDGDGAGIGLCGWPCIGLTGCCICGLGLGWGVVIIGLATWCGCWSMPLGLCTGPVPT